MKKFLLRVAFILMTASSAHAQADFISSLVPHAEAFSDSAAIEKVYLHTDRHSYFAGDTIWYKGYVVDASLRPTQRSQVLHVEWTAPSGKLIRHQQLKVINGEAHSQLTIPIETPDGELTVSAYTNWMRNEDVAFFFTKTFEVLNPLMKTEKNVAYSAAIDLQFFPESGVLVTGIDNHVAFKAIGADGKSLDVFGKIVDGEGNHVSAFRSLHKGMGVLTLTPIPGKAYTAVLNNGRAYPLPAVADTGITIAVSNLDAQALRARVNATADHFGKEYFLVGQSRGKINFYSAFRLTASTDIEIPKKDLPPGILQLTLFDTGGVPLAERMAFIQATESVSVKVDTDHERHSRHQQVVLDIEVTDQRKVPAPASLSLSVTNSTLPAKPWQHNIMTNLLLQSDMKGVIEDPAWYFQSGKRENIFALDLVMLTHGWRKLDWENALANDTLPAVHRAETGITLRGQIINNLTMKPLPRGQISLITGGRGHNGLHFTETDKRGRFTLDNVDFEDSTTQVWRTLDSKGRPVDGEVTIDRPVDTPLITFPPRYQIAQGGEQAESLKVAQRSTGLWNMDSVRMLEEVVVTDKRIKEDRPIRAAGAGSYVLTPQKSDYAYEPGRLLFSIPGIVLLGSGANLQVVSLKSLRYGHRAGDRSGGPWVIVNGIAYDDMSLINSYRTEQIARVEYLAGMQAVPYSGQTGSSPTNPTPVIVIHLKKYAPGDVQQLDTELGTSILYSPGYSAAREFYEPKYLPTDQPAKPDNRITIHWEPKLQVDSTGKARVTFYTPDVVGEMRVIIEGLSDGRPVAVERVVR